MNKIHKHIKNYFNTNKNKCEIKNNCYYIEIQFLYAMTLNFNMTSEDIIKVLPPLSDKYYFLLYDTNKNSFGFFDKKHNFLAEGKALFGWNIVYADEKQFTKEEDEMINYFVNGK